MIVFDPESKVLDTNIFPQHTIADLNSGITFTVLFSQENPLSWNEMKIRTTQTHIHKHGSNNEKLAWNTQTENYKTFGQEEQNIKKQYETYVGFYNYPRKHSKIS